MTTVTPSAPGPAGPTIAARDLTARVMDHIRHPTGGSQAAVFRELPSVAPVLLLPLGMVLVSSAELVRRAAAAPQLVIGEVDFPQHVRDQNPEFVAFFASSLSFLDRADHHRLRRVLSEHFTPRGVDALRPTVAGIVDRLTAEVVSAARTDGEVDLVTAFANELPPRAMGALLGLPEHEWASVAASGRGMLARIASSFPNLQAQDAPITDDGFVALRDRVARLLDEPVADHTLAASLQGARRRDELSREEAVSLMLLLFMTGVDTVAAALTNVVVALLRRPEALADWLAGRTATDAVVHEALRLDAPLPFGMRVAREPLTLGDVQIPAGSTVMLATAAANVDPARHDHPDRWQPGTRPPAQTFGHGTYRCLGALFAGLQCELALDALRPLGVRVTDHRRVQWRSDISFHTPTHLPVALGGGWVAIDTATDTATDTTTDTTTDTATAADGASEVTR
ncbi:cytochrome P450 [Terracoccus luteus]|uniref:Cytochrome P450 n=1 Tax=Terracoccus luteus TaxID=53356 RepID=A0A495Y3J5_9MICO|nr:cytochrome P450 [Terracoccus luteus]RKT79846.1 cytochrome P450 [Terracoccus luteus]